MHLVKLIGVAGLALAGIMHVENPSVNVGQGQQEGFSAIVTGDREAVISGPGRFFCVPAYESPVVERPAYLVVADAGGEREDGITLMVPIQHAPGTYPLEEVQPFDSGSKFEVRAELGSTTDYFNRQVEGTLTLISLPEGRIDGSMDPVEGAFDFGVSNGSGETVEVKGSFRFPAPAPEDETYCE